MDVLGDAMVGPRPEVVELEHWASVSAAVRRETIRSPVTRFFWISALGEVTTA